MTTKKLKIQFEAVETPLEAARTSRDTISAGYSQVMPSQPIAKKVLKTKRKTAAQIAAPELVSEMLALPARMAIEAAMPAAPNSMSGRRPIFSMTKTAIQLARKYSVPLQAAKMRESVGVRPMYCHNDELSGRGPFLLSCLHTRGKTYGFVDSGSIVGDQVDAADLLEALVDEAEDSSVKVAALAVLEQIANTVRTAGREGLLHNINRSCDVRVINWDTGGDPGGGISTQWDAKALR